MGSKNTAKKQDVPPPAPEGEGGAALTEAMHDAPAVPVEGAEPVAAAAAPESPPPPRSRLRRLLPDIVKASLALLVMGLAVAVWLMPPLFRDSFPYASYTLSGQTSTNAVLYRALAVPMRFYVALPEKVADRYQWFAIDRRREIVALMDGPPGHSFFGGPAVKRNAPLGLDLEFRKIDGSEWRIDFFKDAIVFSNNVLSVRLDTAKPGEGGK